jgi:hypothetical protein
MDFSTVPTLTFNLFYCFFIISHDRRRILHFNVTRHPTSSWIVQQLREAFPYQSTPKFLILDHDAKYGLEVPAAIRSMNMGCAQTSIQSPNHLPGHRCRAGALVFQSICRAPPSVYRRPYISTVVADPGGTLDSLHLKAHNSAAIHTVVIRALTLLWYRQNMPPTVSVAVLSSWISYSKTGISSGLG